MNQKLVKKLWDNLFASPSRKKQNVIKKIKNDYYKQVWDISNAQPLNELEGIEKRGADWHLDHIYPIHLGFKNNIPPEEIGHISNLRIISKADNFKKGIKIDGITKTQTIQKANNRMGVFRG